MKTILKIIFVVGFMWTSSLWAAIDECKSDLYYANGIMMKYSEKDALKMWKKEAKKLFKSKPELYEKIANIKISYNQSQGFLDDLIEALEQIMGNEWDWQTFTTFFTVYLTEHNIQEDWVPHFMDLEKQVNSYKESITLGHGVVVVAHSQGNFYTNEAYELLDEWMKQYFHMFGVASPADHVAGFSPNDTTAPYVTFDNDFINSVVTGLSSNLDDTRHHGFPSIDAHDFYESYLKESTAKDMIVNFIEERVKGHTSAPSQWETDQEFDRDTCDYKITVKHRFDSDIIMDDLVYPFAPSKKLYQVNGEYVKASCGGQNILDTWDGKQASECLMIDNPQKEKIYTDMSFVVVVGVDHTYKVIGQYFNYYTQNIDRIVGNTNWNNYIFTIKNNRTGEVGEAVLWRTMNGGSVGTGHGRWNIGYAPGQWQINDTVMIMNLNIYPR